MKKILNTIAIAILAVGVSQAQTRLELYNAYELPYPTINIEGKGAVTTLGSGDTAGYVAAYWWSPNGTDYSVIGISGFLDMEFGSTAAGCFSFTSDLIIPVPETGSEISYLGLTVFRFDDLVGADVEDWMAFFNDMKVTSLDDDANAATIADMWSAAQNAEDGYARGWWGAEVTINNLGDVAPINVFGDGFGWGGDPQYLAAIPEPSTWLLLGAGAAFLVLMRRRKDS